MADIVPAVGADGGTPSSNNKQPLINEGGKQTNLHSLLTPESTPGPDSARNDADKGRRQAEATKKLSTQLNSEQASNKEDLPAEPGQFANNAQGDEDSGDEVDVVMLEANEPLKPDDFRQAIYKEAEQYLQALMSNPKDVAAETQVSRLNEQIKEQNIKDNFPKEDLDKFLIKISTFIIHFELAKGPYGSLLKNPNDENAREKLININNLLNELNKQNGYPETWVVNIPPRTIDVADEAPAKGGVKAKVSVCIPDESNGLTSLGMVVAVRKAGYGSRVIVNRGTPKNPFFEIYPGADFGKGIAKGWLESGGSIKDLPTDTEAKHMTIYGHVKVRSGHRAPQFYLIKVGDGDYIASRSTLSKMKGLSPSKLKRIDGLLDEQNAQLRYELDLCREKNEHPDTGEQLTDADIEQMPWLSPYKMSKPEDEKSKVKSEIENIEDLVSRKKGLERDLTSKITSETSSQL